MACAAFIEALPVIDFVAQLLGKDVISRPLSDSDRVKVVFFFFGEMGWIYLSPNLLDLEISFKCVSDQEGPQRSESRSNT